MAIVGLNEAEQEAILQTVACVLHMGNIIFQNNDRDEAVPVDAHSASALRNVSLLLQVVPKCHSESKLSHGSPQQQYPVTDIRDQGSISLGYVSMEGEIVDMTGFSALWRRTQSTSRGFVWEFSLSVGLLSSSPCKFTRIGAVCSKLAFPFLIRWGVPPMGT